MKRPWEILAAGIVLGELVILAGSPLWAAGAGLAALLLMLLVLRRGPAVRSFLRCCHADLLSRCCRPAVLLFSAAAAAGMLRMAAARVPGEQEKRLDEWMQAGEETGIEFVIGDIREDGDSLKLRSGSLLVYCSVGVYAAVCGRAYAHRRRRLADGRPSHQCRGGELGARAPVRPGGGQPGGSLTGSFPRRMPVF